MIARRESVVVASCIGERNGNISGESIETMKCRVAGHGRTREWYYEAMKRKWASIFHRRAPSPSQSASPQKVSTITGVSHRYSPVIGAEYAFHVAAVKRRWHMLIEHA